MSTTTITTITPADVRGWRHGDAQFLMMLSGACGWTARLGTNKGAQLHSKSGESMLIPDNTGLKMGVFRSWASKIVTHAERKPTAKAVFELMEEAKLDPSHRRVAWEATGMEAYAPPAPGAAQAAPSSDRYKVMSQGKTVFTSDDPAAAVALAEESVTAESGPFKVIEIANGKLFATIDYAPKAAGERTVVRIVPMTLANGNLSHSTNERTWSDGSLDFVCSHDGCDFSATDSSMKVAAHYRKHTKDRSKWRKFGLPPKTGNQPAPAPAAPAEFTPMAVSGGGSHVEREVALDQTVGSLDVSAQLKLDRIVEIVAPGMRAEIASLKAEVAEATKRAETAESKLETLRGLLRGE
jgi:hypothetical protein